MAQYAIAFDLDTVAMARCGLTDSQVSRIYNVEIPQALRNIGFTAHPQGSLYHTEIDQNPVQAIVQLQSGLKTNAPNFCEFVKKVHLFRMEEWSDITDLVTISRRDAIEIPEETIETLSQNFFFISGSTAGDER